MLKESERAVRYFATAPNRVPEAAFANSHDLQDYLSVSLVIVFGGLENVGQTCMLVGELCCKVDSSRI